MTLTIDPEKFSRQWYAAWNAHDIEAVLAHFHDDAVFTSAYGAEIAPETGGIFRGKKAIRDYWAEALTRNPDLHFEPVGTYVGARAVVINYRNHKGGLVNEVLIFDGDNVIEGHGTYL
ncbi:nuclear transport factor 2 family protein [Mycobacteroides salmoniphilum]|uniref:nuclear transport factor 2 family protein n=1 Tax=Mycobacteroides salmoniphilum TaxID=404941 RepID=UPI0010665E4C|nr:nuclear transport factor 2 family protein [Mycobacteroides salmoniphilum]TDZ81312.1 SnoaL-like domain protein [Mycobacteroides salmoniphilum]TDZ88812.1 SnoaL-like domain protein [Mycobacteroides salmoniphilum]